MGEDLSFGKDATAVVSSDVRGGKEEKAKLKLTFFEKSQKRKRRTKKVY